MKMRIAKKILREIGQLRHSRRQVIQAACKRGVFNCEFIDRIVEARKHFEMAIAEFTNRKA